MASRIVQIDSTHTPGPWRTGDMFQTVFGPPNGQPAPYVVAQRIRNRADARLIAAAPALLEALEKMLGDFSTYGDLETEAKKARAAVALARGS